MCCEAIESLIMDGMTQYKQLLQGRRKQIDIGQANIC